ncbi:MAG: hypothetical protein K1W02_10075 [Muribaculaceae bacterium]
MALPLTSLLDIVGQKVERLQTIHQGLHTRIAALEEENNNLRAELEETKKQLCNTRRDVEFLTMSYRLADSPDTIVSARRRIARLIRTIDSCISMLKEE